MSEPVQRGEVKKYKIKFCPRKHIKAAAEKFRSRSNARLSTSHSKRPLNVNYGFSEESLRIARSERKQSQRSSAHCLNKSGLMALARMSQNVGLFVPHSKPLSSKKQSMKPMMSSTFYSTDNGPFLRSANMKVVVREKKRDQPNITTLVESEDNESTNICRKNIRPTSRVSLKKSLRPKSRAMNTKVIIDRNPSLGK